MEGLLKTFWFVSLGLQVSTGLGECWFCKHSGFTGLSM